MLCPLIKLLRIPGATIMNPIETKSRRGGANERGTLSTWVFAGVAAICLGSAGMSALAGPPHLTVAVPAIQGADPAVRTKLVRFGELNLQSDEAIAILYKRIAAAADYVCSPYANRPGVSMIAKWHDRHSSAVTKAVADIGQPRLTHYVAQLRHEPVESMTLAAR
jgi:UrcA family protein